MVVLKFKLNTNKGRMLFFEKQKIHVIRIICLVTSQKHITTSNINVIWAVMGAACCILFCVLKHP